MLGTASPWVGSELVVFDVVFLPRPWLVVDSFYSFWFSRSGFWWYDVYAFFYSSRTTPRFADFVLSPLFLYVLSSHFGFHCCSCVWWLSHSPCLPLQIWIVFSSSMLCGLGSLFLVSNLGSVFSWSVVSFLLMLPLVYLFKVSLLELWSFLSRALWLLAGMDA